MLFHNSINMKGHQGLSLVELLIALTISSILMLGVSTIYLNSGKTDKLGAELSRAQETGRFSIDFMAKDLRMAGYQGCMNPTSLKINIIANNPPTTDLFATAIRGFEVTNTSWANSPPLPAPQVEFDNTSIETRALVGSDVVALQRASTADIQLTGNMAASNANIQITGNPLGFQQNGLVVIASCETADMFRITNNPGTGTGIITLDHSNSSNSDNRLSVPYNTSAKIMTFESIVYFVASTGRVNEQGNPINALFRQTDQFDTTLPNNGFLIEELVEGVDNMQVTYGERLASGNIRYVDAANVTDFQQVTSIHLGLLVSSTSDVLDIDDSQTYSLPGENIAPAGTAGAAVTHAADKRLRRAFTATIDIRNH